MHPEAGASTAPATGSRAKSTTSTNDGKNGKSQPKSARLTQSQIRLGKGTRLQTTSDDVYSVGMLSGHQLCRKMPVNVSSDQREDYLAAQRAHIRKRYNLSNGELESLVSTYRDRCGPMMVNRILHRLRSGESFCKALHDVVMELNS